MMTDYGLPSYITLFPSSFLRFTLPKTCRRLIFLKYNEINRKYNKILTFIYISSYKTRDGSETASE